MAMAIGRMISSAIAVMAAVLAVAGCGGRGDGLPSIVPRSPTTPVPPAPGNPRPPAVEPVEPVEPVAVTAAPVVTGLDKPWAVCFLPDGRIIVTERDGRLRFVTLEGDVSAPLGGVPAVSATGQGGLLDLIASPDFARDRTVYFTFAEKAGASAARTVVARAALGDAGLSDLQVLFRQMPAIEGGLHFGSRLAFDREGMLYVTLGERNEMAAAQDLGRSQGKVLRLWPDGSVPADNPALVSLAPPTSRDADRGQADAGFAVAGVLPQVWTYGHRNPQGIAVHPATGDLWISEHGARGGDEINRLRRGRNYGWPRITTSRDYQTGEPIGEGTAADWVVPPAHDWTPVSPAPAGIAFYTGDKLPGWKGSLLVGMLAGKRLSRLSLDGDVVKTETLHLEALGARIRDVRQAPDGYPYLLSDDGALYRLEPAAVAP